MPFYRKNLNNMIKKYSADFIFDGERLHQNALIEFEQGIVKTLRTKEEHEEEVLYYEGLLLPGLINTHCHLELSHLFGKVPTGTGLLPFLRHVVSMRDVDQREVLDAIEEQNDLMWKAGIQAVGDISNKADTAATKAKSPIQYYSFIEMFDMMQASFTQQSYDQYEAVYHQFDRANGNNKAAVPHAPYTVTQDLFERINRLNEGTSTISIHNQETAHEDQYFINKSGGFSDFYQSIGINDEAFSPTGQPSIYYAMAHMDAAQKTLFIHNTMTTPDHIKDAYAWNKQVFWATCANANLYIENRLPDYKAFLDTNATLTIGTDSLSSNWKLSILEELKTIQKYNSFIPIELLLRWATKNGAAALSFDTLGSFEAGKKPGLVQFKHFDGSNLQSCEVERIF